MLVRKEKRIVENECMYNLRKRRGCGSGDLEHEVLDRIGFRQEVGSMWRFATWLKGFPCTVGSPLPTAEHTSHN
jgi:hypothetical protein